MSRLLQSRRGALRGLCEIGSLSAMGLSLPQLVQADEAARRQPANTNAAANPPARAKSCILFFMEGGPSHIDLWDQKPGAPSNIRGPYQPIATSLPGMQVCEHLPGWARVMDRMCVIRSVTHRFVDHNASSYYALTGQIPLRDGQLIRGPSPQNAPPVGSVVAKLKPSGKPLPDYVHIPKRMFNCGNFIPGVLAGYLGDEYDPFITGDPSVDDFRVPSLQQQLSDVRFDRRRDLQTRIGDIFDDAHANRQITRLDAFYEKAYSLLTSPEAANAFRLDSEPHKLRERYGGRKVVSGHRGNGLPHLGQSFLLARRLVEAGVRLATIWAGGQAFDGHRDLYPALTNGLCPPTDRGFSALIEDLDERGLLDETLVVAVAEFGRTPKLGQVTSSAGANAEGRDHWPHCYTAFLAGAGVKAGTVYGASDGFAAYPKENPVSPGDLAATIYSLLGVDPKTRIRDAFNRPHSLAEGQPIEGVMA